MKKHVIASRHPGRKASGIHTFYTSACLMVVPLILAACGDDITEQINANVGAIESSKDLPECTKDIAGQTAFISETHEFLGCDGKEWQPLSASTVSVGDNVCMSKSLSDDTGFEIFCNGESIGTVKNGKDGVDGKDGTDGAKGDKGDDGAPGAKGDKGDKGDDGAKGDPGDPGKNGTNGTNGINGTSCEITESTALTATIACGSETFTMDLTGYVDQPEECDATLYEDCTGPVDVVKLSGVSQKGPFVTGTDITAYELENGRSLKQTGKTFGGKIEREDGTFDIKTVKLKSTFAYLVADGFYRNEVTGENSAATIKLRALTNLQGRTAANINLVTHLEYDRVQRLVTKEDSSVLKAKKAAEREIFAAFGIDNKDFKGFAEDFNILEEGDGNAALLAISALLQGDRNESELTALLAALSVDLGDNGLWDNEKLRAQIADWAMKKDIDGGLAAIRANIKAWKLRDGEPPAFEGHFRNFWMQEFGVGECSTGNTGALFATKNKKSAYYAAKDSVFTEGDSSLARLICDASGEWRFATDLEKDVAAFGAADNGTVNRGSIDTTNVYVKDNGNWRRGTELDARIKACVSGNRGETDSIIVKHDTTWYTCDDSDDTLVPTAWRKATTAEADTALFGIPGEGDAIVRLGNVNKSYVYVFEDVDGDGEGEWRYGTSLDYDQNLGPCLGTKVGVIDTTSKGKWYKCVGDLSTLVEGYTIPTEWREATSFERDTLGFGKPSKDTARFNSANTVVYVYDKTAEKWRIGSIRDTSSKLGPCTEAMKDTIRGTGSISWFKCSSNSTTDINAQPVSWIELTQAEFDTLGFGHCKKDYMKGNKTYIWYLKNGTQVSNAKEEDLIRYTGDSICVAPVSNSTIEVYYGAKPAAVDGDTVMGNKANTCYTYDKVLADWLPMEDEQCYLGLGGCTITRANHTEGSNSDKTTFPKGMVKKDASSSYYLCKDDGGVRKWVLASVARYDTYGYSCGGSFPRRAYKGKNTSTAEYTYVCDADTFRTMTASEKWALDNADDVNRVRCTAADEGESVLVSVAGNYESEFVCRNMLYVWDNKEQLISGSQLTVPSTYNKWEGNAVVMGTRLWLTSNLYTEQPSAAGGIYNYSTKNYVSEHGDLRGSFYKKTDAQTACASFKYKGESFKLPSSDDYRYLLKHYVNKHKQAFSRYGWSIAGTDDYNLTICPNGKYTTISGNGNVNLGYYTNSNGSMTIPSSSPIFAAGKDSVATLQVSDDNKIILLKPEAGLVFETNSYAGVRCVIGEKENPPTSN